MTVNAFDAPYDRKILDLSHLDGGDGSHELPDPERLAVKTDDHVTGLLVMSGPVKIGELRVDSFIDTSKIEALRIIARQPQPVPGVYDPAQGPIE